MAQALRAYFATNESIRRAWLFLMENEGERSYLVILDVVDSETHGDFGEVSSVVMPFLDGMYLDLMELGDEFSVNATAGMEPFYTAE
jgi:hypothetical protein